MRKFGALLVTLALVGCGDTATEDAVIEPNATEEASHDAHTPGDGTESHTAEGSAPAEEGETAPAESEPAPAETEAPPEAETASPEAEAAAPAEAESTEEAAPEEN